jgi:hypothetical protein
MNVGIGKEATQFHFWEYKIGFLVQCIQDPFQTYLYIWIRLHITNSGKHEPLFLVGIVSLQKTNIENSKQIFLEKEMRSHNPYFHIHLYVSDLYIYPTIDLPILLQEVCGPILGIHCINRSQTHECGNWDWGRAIPRKGILKWDFSCSVWKLEEVYSYTHVNEK